MTIGVAFLWWIGSLIGAFIVAIAITLAVGFGVDDDLGSGLGGCLGIIIAVFWKIALIVLLIWWGWAMFTQGLNPFEALDYKMW